MKDYTNYTGPVTFHGIVGAFPNGTRFASIEDFWIGLDRIGRLGRLAFDIEKDRMDVAIARWPDVVAEAYLRDETGLRIPAYFVSLRVAKARDDDYRAWAARWHARIRGNYDPADFRSGPVARTGKSRGRRRRRYYPNGPAIRQEVAENESLAYEEDCVDHGISCRSRRTRNALGDPVWDNEYARFPDDRSWKRHRASQWKPR